MRKASRRGVTGTTHVAFTVWYRLHHLVREGLKFFTVGSFGFVVDFTVFNLLIFAGGEGPLHDSPLVAKTLAVIVATVVTFSGNRAWTFRHRARTGLRREYTLFFLFNAIGLGIALACLSFSRYVLELTGPLADNISANVVGLALGSLFRFWSYRTWVFPAPDTLPQDSAPQGAVIDGPDRAVVVPTRSH